MATPPPAHRPDPATWLDSRVLRALAAVVVVVAAALVVPALTQGPDRVRTVDAAATDDGSDPTVDGSGEPVGAAVPTSTTDAAGPADDDADGEGDGADPTDPAPAPTPGGTTATSVPGTSTTVPLRTTTTRPVATTLAPAPTAPATTGPAAGACTADSGAAASVAASFTGYRSNEGLAAMARSSGLDRVAQDWACRMAASRTLAHNPDYRSQVAAVCGCSASAENVAYNQSAGAAWSAWLASSDHRTNIRDARGGTFGVGVARSADGTLWFVHNFAH